MDVLRTEHLNQPSPIAAATVRELASLIGTANEQITALEGQVEANFGQHPDAEIDLRQPGLGPVLGARRVRRRPQSLRRRPSRNYAGTSPSPEPRVRRWTSSLVTRATTV